MKLTTICKKCGKIISTVEKDQISDSDLAEYESNSVCATDGPFPAVMYDPGDGSDPVEVTPAVDNTIVAVRTES